MSGGVGSMGKSKSFSEVFHLGVGNMALLRTGVESGVRIKFENRTY